MATPKPLPSPDTEDLTGSSVGRFAIRALLGVGGMGEVYRADDTKLKRQVAVKRVSRKLGADERSRQRILKEAQRACALSSQHIASVYDVLEEDGEVFLVMEYVEGATLRLRLRSAGAIPLEQFLDLAVQCSEALANAHQKGIVHRDIKPENIMITPAGQVKILDFGLAKHQPLVEEAAVTASLESQGSSFAGTPGYMAPEALLEKEVDHRSDIFSLGVVFYEMLTGRHPFRAEKMMVTADRTLNQAPAALREVVPDLPAELQRIVSKMLAKDPAERYATAADLLVDLKNLQRDLLAPGGELRRRPRLLTGRWAIAGLAAVTLIVLAAALIGLNVRGLRDRLLGVPGTSQIKSLAVLPLANLSGDPEQSYFADGMTEELIMNLSKISALRVISRTSVMHYKGGTKALPQIAKELNVDAIVEGSVLKVGGRVRITAQLFDAAADRPLWGRSYEEDLKDVLSLQADVAQAISAEIQGKLNPQERTRLASARPVKPEAYEAYLKGRYYLGKRNQEAVLNGLKYFQEAVRIDPTSALAYAGVADSYVVLEANHWLSPGEAVPQGRAAALKALEIDDTLAEAHTSLAAIAESDWDWTTTEKEYKRALEFNPSYALARHWYSYYLSKMGRHEEAVAQARRAAELDPRSIIINVNLGQVLYMARRYDEGEQQLFKALELDPNFWPVHYCLGVVYVQKGRFEEGIAELERAAILSPEDDVVLDALGYAYAKLGRKAEAQKVLDDLKKRSSKRYVSGYLLALSYLGLGEKGEAIQWLERAYKERDEMVAWIGTEPMFNPLRSDARFQDLLHRMNLPQAGPSH